ncbi:hypothetical protein CFP56_018379, partial [Quercus suber]
ELQSDLQVVLKGGPWYVGQHFLAIRKWELEFKAEEASLFFVAVWIRLPRLPIEFYDPIILKKTGRAIGPFYILTLIQLMVREAILLDCVQVNIDQPFINSMRNGKMVHPDMRHKYAMLCMWLFRSS